MATYISILRGINVSGKNMIKMTDLKKVYEDLNFKNVLTYLQSGNVIFNARTKDEKALENTIPSAIKKVFDLEVPVMVLTPGNLEEIINGNPFIHDSKWDTSFLHVTFLAKEPAQYDKERILNKRLAGEEVAFSSRVVYLYCPNGYGKTNLNNNFLERQLKVTATTRNWKTTTALLQLAEEAGK